MSNYEVVRQANSCKRQPTRLLLQRLTRRCRKASCFHSFVIFQSRRWEGTKRGGRRLVLIPLLHFDNSHTTDDIPAEASKVDDVETSVQMDALAALR